MRCGQINQAIKSNSRSGFLPLQSNPSLCRLILLQFFHIMPLCNRVTPFGSLTTNATKYETAFAVMANRGCIHDDAKRIVAQFKNKAWLTCEIQPPKRKREIQRDDNRSFNGRKRVVMSPGHYTELFFIDEPTACAAGHRPCACCRRSEFRDFMNAWSAAHGDKKDWRANDVDAILHAERRASSTSVGDGGGVTLSVEQAAALPNGAFVERTFLNSGTAIPPEREAWLCWEGRFHRWSHLGYDAHESAASLASDSKAVLSLLTPPSMVATMRAGFNTRLPHRTASL